VNREPSTINHQPLALSEIEGSTINFNTDSSLRLEW